jgi:hypothetical protein
MDQSQNRKGPQTELQGLPLVGIYSCLYCERSYSTKPQLKHHYYNCHQNGIPNYEGNEAKVIRRITRAEDLIERIARTCSDVPSSGRMIVLLILFLIYHGS